MDDTKTSSGPLTARWIHREDHTEVYSNQFFLNWSTTDVRIRFGQMIPTNEVNEKVTFVIEESAAITMSWVQIKALRDSLTEAVTRYEKTNGQIDLLSLKLPQ